MKHDESAALACLFDCWQPKWRKVDGPYGFLTDIKPALKAFGFECVSGAPLRLAKHTVGIRFDMCEESALLCAHRDLMSNGLIGRFRRSYPSRVILCAKSGLYWVVWDKSTPTNPRFYISTAEYTPSLT